MWLERQSHGGLRRFCPPINNYVIPRDILRAGRGILPSVAGRVLSSCPCSPARAGNSADAIRIAGLGAPPSGGTGTPDAIDRIWEPTPNGRNEQRDLVVPDRDPGRRYLPEMEPARPRAGSPPNSGHTLPGQLHGTLELPSGHIASAPPILYRRVRRTS
jgi:hypothetical protein